MSAGTMAVMTTLLRRSSLSLVPVVLAGSLLAGAYVFRVIGHAFGHGPAPARRLTLAREEVPALVLAIVATVGLGLFAAPLWTLLGAASGLGGEAP